MKKVGIITLHRVTNYGSVLQTYALQQAIINLGYDVEIIDYQPKRITLIGMLKGLKNKNQLLNRSFIFRSLARLILLPSYILRFRTFKKFIITRLHLTKKKYSNEEELLNEKFNYDIYCTGSDQVWNSEWNEKIDRPFYLSFAPINSKKIAYAASFGRTELFDWEVKETVELLEKYDKISLREKSGVDILEKLDIKGSINVVDPTLLLNNKEWSRLASDRFCKGNYILVYNLNRNKKIYKYAKNLSEKTGLKVKYITYQLHDVFKYGKMYCNIKVEDFISLIKNAQYIVTDSFHGTVFSLNFNKQFVIIFPGKFSTRIKSILEITNLENRVAKDENDLQIIDKNIDFNFVNKIIEQEREKSIKWLKESME